MNRALQDIRPSDTLAIAAVEGTNGANFGSISIYITTSSP